MVLAPVFFQIPRQTLPVEGGGVSFRISVPSPFHWSKPVSTNWPPDVNAASHSPVIELVVAASPLGAKGNTGRFPFGAATPAFMPAAIPQLALAAEGNREIIAAARYAAWVVDLRNVSIESSLSAAGIRIRARPHSTVRKERPRGSAKSREIRRKLMKTKILRSCPRLVYT